MTSRLHLVNIRAQAELNESWQLPGRWETGASRQARWVCWVRHSPPPRAPALPRPGTSPFSGSLRSLARRPSSALTPRALHTGLGGLGVTAEWQCGRWGLGGKRHLSALAEVVLGSAQRLGQVWRLGLSWRVLNLQGKDGNGNGYDMTVPRTHTNIAGGSVEVAWGRGLHLEAALPSIPPALSCLSRMPLLVHANSA